MAINTAYDQYKLGKGRFYFAQTQGDGTLGPYRFIGNVPAFSLTPSSDSLEHVSSIGGINVKDREIQTSNDLAIAFTTDNMSRENQALWSGGTVDTVTQTSLTAQTETVAAPKVKKGFLYTVGAADTGRGLKDITVTSITQGATTLVLGTDYSVNTRTGFIALLTTGAATEGTAMTITYNVAASSKDIVANRALSITGAVRFESDNPDTGTGVSNEEHFLPRVRLSADGDWGLIGDDWQSFGFSGTVLQLSDQAGNPVPRHTITPLTA